MESVDLVFVHRGTYIVGSYSLEFIQRTARKCSFDVRDFFSDNFITNLRGEILNKLQ